MMLSEYEGGGKKKERGPVEERKKGVSGKF